MGALSMLQQISRSRNTKKVSLLVLDKYCMYNFNQNISFEDCKKIQNIEINKYMDNYNELCKYQQISNSLGNTYLDNYGNIVLNKNSFFTDIHHYKIWYDQLFHRNKIDILTIFAKEYGYNVQFKMLNDLFSKNTINKDVKLLKNEIITISELIYDNKEVDDKYIHFIDNLKEQINVRKNILLQEDIVDNNIIKKLSCDKQLFDNWNNKKVLDMDFNKYNQHKLNYYKYESPQIAKDNFLFNQIDAMFFLEKYFNFKRYQVNDILNLDIIPVQKFLLENVDKLYFIFKNNEWKNKTISKIKKRITSFNSTNHVQKFIADCYNHIANESISVKKKIVKKNNIRYTFYIFNQKD